MMTDQVLCSTEAIAMLCPFQRLCVARQKARIVDPFGNLSLREFNVAATGKARKTHIKYDRKTIPVIL